MSSAQHGEKADSNARRKSRTSTIQGLCKKRNEGNESTVFKMDGRKRWLVSE